MVNLSATSQKSLFAKNQNRQTGKLYSLFLGLLLFLVPLSTLSAEESSIVVTGTSLDKDLDDLPASASVLSGEEIAQQGSDYLQEQIIQIPNFNFSGGTARPRYFQIRGIGELEQYEGAPNTSVAVIVDDVDLTGIGAALTLFDIEQLEVHRGPQPIRFGSSALAGAINVVTKDPTDVLSGRTQLSVGNDELFSVGAAAGGALTPNLTTRITAFGHSQNGFRDNQFLGVEDTNERKEFTGRAKFRLTPSEDARLTLSLTNVDINNGYDVFTILNGFDTQSDRPGIDEERLRLASLQGEFDLTDSTQLRTTTSIYKSEVDYSFDGDWGNNPFWAPFDPYDFFSDTDRERTVFAQQVRLTGDAPVFGDDSRYLAGMYFQNLEEDTITNEFSDDQVFDLLDSDYQVNTYAIFGNLEVPLTSQLALLVGARGEYRDQRYSDNRSLFFAPDDLLWGGNVTLQYEHDEENLSYVEISRGFRGEGFNVSPSLPENRTQFASESLLNFEVGNRFHFFDRSLQGAISAFYNRRMDQQIKLALQVDPNDPLSFTFLTDNAARGEGAGLELEMDYLATERFTIHTAGSLLHTEVTSVDDPSLLALEGRDQSHAPNWQYAVEGEYFLSDSISAAVGITGRDGFFFDDSHNQKSEPYHLLNASIRYYGPGWRLALWGRNLTDKKYAVRGFFFGNEPPDFPETEYIHLGDPLTFGLTFTYEFGQGAA